MNFNKLYSTVILNIYKDQVEVIKIEGYEKEVIIKKVVKQVCSLPSLLFNLFIDNVLHDDKNKRTAEIKTYGEKI